MLFHKVQKTDDLGILHTSRSQDGQLAEDYIMVGKGRFNDAAIIDRRQFRFFADADRHGPAFALVVKEIGDDILFFQHGKEALGLVDVFELRLVQELHGPAFVELLVFVEGPSHGPEGQAVQFDVVDDGLVKGFDGLFIDMVHGHAGQVVGQPLGDDVQIVQAGTGRFGVNAVLYLSRIGDDDHDGPAVIER